eukprot:4099736-Amphidinium_carterae.1
MAYLVVEVKDYGPTKVPFDGVSHMDDLKKELMPSCTNTSNIDDDDDDDDDDNDKNDNDNDHTTNSNKNEIVTTIKTI